MADLMRCQKRGCSTTATKIRDIPTVGDSLCFCDDHVRDELREFGKDFGWYDLTAERMAEELEAEKATQRMIDSMRESFAKRGDPMAAPKPLIGTLDDAAQWEAFAEELSASSRKAYVLMECEAADALHDVAAAARRVAARIRPPKTEEPNHG